MQGLVFLVDASDGLRLEEARRELAGEKKIKTKNTDKDKDKDKENTKTKTKVNSISTYKNWHH